MDKKERDLIVGTRLRTALEKRGMKAREFAEAMNEKPALVSHWMTATRPMRAEALDRAAQLLGVNRAWLAAEPETVADEGQVAAAGDALEVAHWYMRPAPDDGGRDYGNSNIFATPPTVATLAREAGQNTSDQALRGSAGAGVVHMRYSLIELTKDAPEYRRFLDAIKFDQLREHMDAAALGKSRLATKLREGLRRLDEEDTLVLLRIDDFGTTGLEGREPDEERDEQERRSSPYTALVRNNLDSSKLITTAGGSFGLGKAVLWNCSGLSTVLFASELSEGRRDAVRVVGKTELAWHRDDERAYAGPGWFGQGRHGGSLWVTDAQILQDLQLDRTRAPEGVDPSARSGASALIIGFRDPETETRLDSQALLEKLSEAVAVNFFPLMLQERMRVTLEHVRNGKVLSAQPVNAQRYVPEFWQALKAHYDDEIVEQLDEPGSVTRRYVNVRIPATRDDAEGVVKYADDLEAQFVVVVRLADAETAALDHGEGGTRLDRVAVIRGRGMVTEYMSKSNLVVGARPFHAILLAGEAVSTDPPQLAAEQFLRLAEPPAHDRWEYGDELRGKYRRGSSRAINEIKMGLTDALRDAVRPVSVPHDDGPDELKRLLQLHLVGTPEAPAATLRNIRSTMIDGAWHVEADVTVNDKLARLRVTPRLWIDVESGAGIPLPWASTEVRIGRQRAPFSGSFELEPNARGVSFSGLSMPEAAGVVASRCRAKLDVAIDVISDKRSRARTIEVG